VACNRVPCEASAAIGGMFRAWVGAGDPLARGLEHKALTVGHDLIFRTVAHCQEKAPSRAVIRTGTTAGPGTRPLRSLGAAERVFLPPS
jgi:hypothetical protein